MMGRSRSCRCRWACTARSTPLHHQDIANFVTVARILVRVVIFVPNPLIAQLEIAYDGIYSHMVGLARMNHMGIIVETMQTVTKLRWERFVESLQVDVYAETLLRQEVP